MTQRSTAAASSGGHAGSIVTSRRPPSPAEGATDTRPAEQSSVITESGPASELVASGVTGANAATAAFRMEGIYPTASDAQVRNLVWPLVSNLHACHEVQRGVHAETKSY